MATVKPVIHGRDHLPGGADPISGIDSEWEDVGDTTAGGITEITSVDLSVTITDPTGPIVDLSVVGGGGGDTCGPWIYVGTPTQVAGQTDENGTLVSDLVDANPAPFNADPWVPFEGDWNNSLGQDAPVSFMLDGCLVVPRGGAYGGDPGTVIFYLPDGYRPFYQQEQIYPTGVPTVAAACIIGTDGAVTYEDVISGSGSGGATEYDYVERTSNLTVTATSAAAAQTWIDGTAVAYDGVTRVCVECWAAYAAISSAQSVIFELYDGSTDIGRLWLIQCPTVSAGSTLTGVHGKRFFTPSAATHTYKVKAWKSGGTATIFAGAGGADTELPAWIRITLA